jgi:hypothetical protein
MQRAIISILAGQVFPKPIWSLRWRHTAMDIAVFVHKYFALVPRREPCRLVTETPQPLPWLKPVVEVLPPPRRIAEPAPIPATH